jgi:UDP-N-acetylglucosamine/UDP-N-acetylgalactosamine diphosphorylase
MAMQRETAGDGQLRYVAGSIAIHVLDREFVRRMAAGSTGSPQAGSTGSPPAGGEGASLPFHRADKKIATVDVAGQPVKPEKPNGVKFEMFVFDALPFARNPLVIETLRADDFSPVKNAEGVDSPQTCRDDQSRQFARWLTANGAPVPAAGAGRREPALEVSPLFGYDEDSFADSWKKLSPKPAVTDGLYLE